ncbi:MAG: DNA translocase FtsK 4TM domain-containing protein [Eubacterium sp.]|nr:DNA translocase FtsK 4TM domain-containing protein [Eubacterium sp.]
MAENNVKRKQSSSGGGAGKGSGRKTTRTRAKGAADQKTKKKTNTPSAAAAAENGIPMSNEIQMVASIGIMILLMLSNFGLCGYLGKALSSFLFGVFGCVQYVMPVAFCLGVIILIANDYSLLSIKKCTAGFVTLIMISAFAQVIYQGDKVKSGELFALAIEDHHAGGILGGGIGLVLKTGFGTAGALVIVCCILLVSLIMLTQRSFVGFFQNNVNRGGRFVDKLKENRQITRERRRQEKLLRLEEEEEDLNDLEESNGKVASFLKMKTGRKMPEDAPDENRIRQCEEKVRKIQETRKEKFRKSARAAKERLMREPEIHRNVPVFTSSDEVKKKDNVKELHPKVYPFTAEDGKTRDFDGQLDFSAFTFRSGKSPDDFENEIDLNSRQLKEFLSSLEEYEVPGRVRPKSSVSELTASPEEILLEAMEVHDQADHDQEGINPSVITDKQDLSENQDKQSISGEEDRPEIIEAEADEDEMSAFHIVEFPEEDPDGPDISEAADAININRAAAPKAAPSRKPAGKKDYIFPPMNLLVTEKQTFSAAYDQELKSTALKLQNTLQSFGVNVTITDISCGPAVTRYEMFPEQGTKVSKIVSLTDDIKLNLAAQDIRIEAPIPGKAAIGIEVPNKETTKVHLRELIDNRLFQSFKSKLAFAVGKDIGGKIVVADLAKMPHLLIAGATGSGKSVCINTLIMSLLYKATPDEVKLIMIDPKMVELSVYNGIPHLLIPVVTDPKKASGALNWAVAEMTNRYKQFSECNVRNIEGYNKKVDSLIADGQVDEEKMQRMPQIVIIIDELADLMMVAPGEVEDAIVRLSQLARAAGIHLVIATQRPSVNVITGLIKANVPSRIAFSVSSGVDSRTIIDMNGAEKLLGKGDMLFYPSGYQKPVRVQGALVDDSEVAEVVEFIKNNEDVAVYDDKVTETIEKKIMNSGGSSERDEYFEAAARFIMEKDKATIGMLQRMFKIGFNRAARIIDQLAEAGIVGPEEGTKPRKILMSPEQLEQYFEEYL